MKKIQEIMSHFRNDALPLDIIKKYDYKDGIDGLPKSDVLKFFIKDGWLAVRPSGTEPKIKFYFNVFADNQEKANDNLNKICAEIMKYSR